MTIFDLGQQLREKQLRLKLIPKELVNVVTNEDIVDAYFICSVCEQRVFAAELERQIIEESKDADEFTERITIGLKWHQRLRHNNPRE
jgi:hypothetical protein